MKRGSASSANRPVPVSKHYLGVNGEHYFEWQQGWGLKTGKIEARKFQKHISDTDHVLDFGCGGGYVLKALRCKKKLGIEVNPRALTECSRNEIEATDTFERIKSNSFDVAISNHSLEHVPYPLGSLKQLRRVLRPEGVLVICTPIDDWRKYRSYSSSDPHHHLHTWTPQNLGNLLTEAGFVVEDVRILTHAWPPKVVLLDKLLPLWLFDGICTMWSVIHRQRQIIAVARKPQR